jgi:hypothetical protein
MLHQSEPTEQSARHEEAVAADTQPARRRPVWFALMLLVLIGVSAALPLRTPEPQPASAPADAFSAQRALDLLGGIAERPHPTGSAAQDGVRDLLVDRLRGLGLQPKVIDGVAQGVDDPTTLGRSASVHARIKGSRPTGSVLLVAHYDSIPTGPGASDDGANVAAVLEIVRALRTGSAPRNDIDIVLTDGEEQGRLGAQRVVDSKVVTDPAKAVVINLEARGTEGPAVMFEKAGPGLVPAVRASGAVTTSAADAVYGILPNDTDLTVFHQAGMRGLNFAFVGGAARYHTPGDDIASVSPRSVQSMGDAGLAAVRQLAAADLGKRGTESTYFSVFGVLVSYPSGLVLPLAILAATGFVALLWWGRRRGLSPRGTARAAAAFPLVLLAAVAIGQAGWWGLMLLKPNVGLTDGFPHDLAPYILTQLVLLLTAVCAWYRWTRRSVACVDVATAVIGWFALLSLVLAVFVPGAAYLTTWPALVGAVAVAAALRTTRSGWLNAVVTCAVAVPAAVLLVPVCSLLVPVLGVGLMYITLVLVALLTATAAGIAELLPQRRAVTAGLVASALAAVATFGITALVDTPDAATPQPVSLGYVLNADDRTAQWVSFGDSRQPVVGRMLTEAPHPFDDRVPALGGEELSTGPAKAVSGTAAPGADKPVVAKLDGVRTVRVTLQAPADAFRLDVRVGGGSPQLLGATVDGVRVPVEKDGRHTRFQYVAPPKAGIELVLRVRGNGPVPVRAVSTAAGLPSGVGAPQLPDKLQWSRWPSVAGQTFAVRTFHF